MTIEGKKKKIKREHFERLVEGLGLTPKQLKGVFNRFRVNKVKAYNWIDNSFLKTEMKEAYTALFEDRYARVVTG